MLAALIKPPPLSDLAAEATVGVVEGLLYERVGGGQASEVLAVAPIGTYVALAPQLGAEEAWQVACG